ncbi:NAD(P)H-dependent oxidoreductase [Mangrovibacillus cuniculi]|uniref:General stress protein n=1 Tax=Mangrovibacillus cuniculi TaxID=2593652 RepID=A0A7S8C9B9_9BACI|nr:NAD(P)H-dependent oxidoreductase [Mangrovibacillus cuniculi]QPC45671.1 general stress protein [Mangrovibacillus cuniculi]
MKILVIVAHPSINESIVNKHLATRWSQEENVTVHYLYTEYPDRKIDVQREQELLLAHDRILFQFPLYWYSSPSLLKEWQDVVLEYGWAYGTQGTKLHGKEFGLIISTGGPETAYQAGGFNHYSISELTKPFQATANLTGMRFLPTYAIQGVRTLSPEDLSIEAERMIKHF